MVPRHKLYDIRLKPIETKTEQLQKTVSDNKTQRTSSSKGVLETLEDYAKTVLKDAGRILGF
jgi:hypothetical protein